MDGQGPVWKCRYETSGVENNTGKHILKGFFSIIMVIYIYIYIHNGIMIYNHSVSLGVDEGRKENMCVEKHWYLPGVLHTCVVFLWLKFL